MRVVGVRVEKLTNLMARLPKEGILHNMETGQYMRVILRVMGKGQMEEPLLWKGLSPFDYHDIGKILLPRELAYQDQLFSDAQRYTVMGHVDYGEQIFRQIWEEDSTAELFGKAGGNIALFHHECYDGSGYPDGRKEDEIPFLARVCAVANSFSVLRKGSSFSSSWSLEESLVALEKRSGTWFDPEIVSVFTEKTREALE